MRNKMINTVLGPIPSERLGLTLMHEHILVDYIGADHATPDRYDRQEVVATMLPYLSKLKQAGCNTFVDATPPGDGRDVHVLRECSLQSGLQIITCTGTFKGKGVSTFIRQSSIEEIVALWESEFREGIDGTEIRPGFIKIALDDGPISPLQGKILRAAARTSLRTGLPIQAHTLFPKTAYEAVNMLKEEGLPLNKWIWTHADCEGDLEAMIALGKQGIWLDVDGIGYRPYEEHVRMLQELIRAGLVGRVLLSQDRGWYVVGPDKGKYVNPYHPILTEFLPLCSKAGIAEEDLAQMLVRNPMEVLTIE